jgi:hypothetical protein
MSLFSDIGNFVSGAVSTVSSLATTAASIAFPEAAIASSLTNVLAQGFGGAIGSAVQGLMQGGGMPSFIGNGIMDVVKGVVDQLTQHGNQGCDDQVKSQCGNGLQDFFHDFANKLQQCALQNMNEGCEGGKGGKGGKAGGSTDGGSWYEALAKALGQALDAQTDKIKDLSSKVGALNDQAQGIDSSDTKATKQNDSDKASTMTDLQAASQKLSFMMSAASDVLKTIGQAINQMAGKN